uniref:Uncharacterized protein n=1 Tax=Parascaris univalens TaxID=6257 RepID=A0A914ZQV0_PARUN
MEFILLPTIFDFSFRSRSCSHAKLKRASISCAKGFFHSKTSMRLLQLSLKMIALKTTNLISPKCLFSCRIRAVHIYAAFYTVQHSLHYTLIDNLMSLIFAKLRIAFC